MSWKNFLKDYLSFGRQDRIGAIVFVLMMLIIVLLPVYFANTRQPLSVKPGTVLLKAMDTLASAQGDKYEGSGETDGAEFHPYEPARAKSFTEGALFQFDPNTLPVEGWQRLGLNEKTSKTIAKYRSKGGKFYKPEDIKKIWGMPEGFFERVKDYIVIVPAQNNYPQNDFAKTAYTRPEKKIVVVAINEADTAAFIALPGIGSKLASRIISFRDKLGGFYSIDQVGETYGLPDSTFQKIKPSLQLSGPVKRLNVNTASKDELKMHPYIRWNLANAIVEYRNQHGSFKSLEELKNIMAIDEATYSRIVHYLSL
jgi:competence protein ComEA